MPEGRTDRCSRRALPRQRERCRRPAKSAADTLRAGSRGSGPVAPRAPRNGGGTEPVARRGRASRQRRMRPSPTPNRNAKKSARMKPMGTSLEGNRRDGGGPAVSRGATRPPTPR
uniref:Uncharacterized protein n=1 Tax=Siphoviridae sp. ctPrm3 TaxID=2827864 RepID=A0A8S5TPC3_9CAUD|nr:MAG TPA: hypothetical protein [Siphoviridae sp. ctPrm3]